VILVFTIVELLVGWIYGHLLEYLVHRFLYSLLKNKDKASLKTHDRLSFINLMCRAQVYGSNTEHFKKEKLTVAIIVIVHLPLITFFPFMFLSILLGGISYLVQHRACHSDVKTAREYYSWHYDHHMSGRSDMNFGVRMPIFDILLGTRLIYRGTKREKLEYGKKLLRHKRFRELLLRYKRVRRMNKGLLVNEDKDKR